LVASLGLAVATTVGTAVGVELVFGPGFDSVPTLVAVLMCGAVPYAAAKVLGGFVAGAGALRPNLWATVLTFVLTLAMDLLLIPRYGAVGASVASAISYAAYTAMVYRIAKKVVAAPTQT
jgi:O-antigen/teichoic acid export membrane protein